MGRRSDRRPTRPSASRASRRHTRTAAGLALAFFLSACGAQFQLPCPPVRVLGQAKEVVKFAPGQPFTRENVAYRGEITDAKLTCQYDMESLEELEVALGIQMFAERGPADRTGAADLDYFVAILDRRGNVLAKETFNVTLPFEGDRDSVGKVEEIYQKIPLEYPQNGGSFEIWVGFQLSDEELEYIRRRRGV